MPITDDTIVAVSSPPGRGWRGLIRLSGPQSHLILAKWIDDALPPPRRLASVRLVHEQSSLPALAVRFEHPRSYTGQDMVELQLPGQPALLDRLLHDCIARGARLAEPGEYTFRAYLAGKLDLTQAEGIAATITATSDSQLHAATLLRQRQLGRFASDIVDQIGSLLALVESGIDFTDQDDVVPIAPTVLRDRLNQLASQLDHLLAHSRGWNELDGIAHVVLAGAPSAGKSTLFNALLGRKRAVISEMPGTTRDILAEPLTLRDAHDHAVEIMLVDIAGLDDPLTAMDKLVQQHARDAIRRADLIVHITGDRINTTHDIASLAAPRTPVLNIRTKCDISPPADSSNYDIIVSAHTGEGIDQLRRAITQCVGQRAVSISADLLALQPRHAHALHTARTALDEALRLLNEQDQLHHIEHIELVARALRTMLDALASLGGTLTPDDILGRVFATFCVGK